MKQTVKNIFEKLTGYKIIRKYPFGVDQISDIKNRFPGFVIKNIIDVGANIGQSAMFFSDRIPEAEIFSLEPSEIAFKALQKNVQHIKNVHSFNYAVGQFEGTGVLSQGNETTVGKVDYVDNKEMDLKDDKQIIEFISLSSFCEKNKIDRVNYLKIDTEGFDLEVLKSGEKYLMENRVDFIEVEAGMHKQNTDHVPFEQLHSYLQSKNYYLFGIYEQHIEWKLNLKCMRRCNPVYVSQTLI